MVAERLLGCEPEAAVGTTGEPAHSPPLRPVAHNDCGRISGLPGGRDTAGRGSAGKVKSYRPSSRTPVDPMPPLLFRLVGLVNAIGGLLYVVKPAEMLRWNVRRRTGTDADIRPSATRLWFSRLVGVVLVVVGLAVASGQMGLLA